MMAWRYYNHAMIPTTAPHEKVDISAIDDGSVWKTKAGTPLLARWTTDWDCGYETEWWYVIKDTPFDISALKSKRRYEINKGKKNFEVKKIAAAEYAEELLEVQIAAFSGWPEKYRPPVDSEEFLNGIKDWIGHIVYGGFERETGKMVAYAYLIESEKCLEFSVLRSNPYYERNGVNAAMVAAIVEDYNGKLSKDFYICDGARSIRHETDFQNYLEKYFGFRKAYCKLNVKYRKGIGLLIKCLYPVRTLISDKTNLGSKMSGILKMEEILRG